MNSLGNMGSTQQLRSFVLVVASLAALVALPSCKAQLSIDFYASSCPNAPDIIRAVLAVNLLRDLTLPAALLRLFFHDCQVQGCDASILLNSQGGITSEMDSPANFGIRRLDLIDSMKAALEAACPNTLSCADIIVLAAREAVHVAGGPFVPVPVGRRDGTNASTLNADRDIPPASINLDEFIHVFASKGMTLRESVAILGSHTLGVGHCVNIVNRLYPQTDASLGFVLKAILRLQCPPNYGPRAVLPNDFTPLIFDTQYFSNTLARRGLFTVDSEVARDLRTAPIVQSFSQNAADFFQDFASAFVKLSLTGVLTGAQGEIRHQCRLLN